MLFSPVAKTDNSARAGLFNSGEKLRRADDELLFVALQHDGSFAGSKGRPPLNGIGSSLKDDLLPGTVLFELQVIMLWIDLFHGRGFNNIFRIKA
jgi:hypothetical protein